MRRSMLLLALLWAPLALAGVLNVEFEFTPYTGDLKQDKVEAVPGTAQVFVNGALMAQQEVRAGSLPVLFDEREVGPSVWITGSSLGPALRKGANKIRIEFVPRDMKAPYVGQLSWSQVTDEVTESDDGAGSHTSTNQAGAGKEDRPAKGKLVFERDFQADFATDRPWHHYPKLTALSDADKAQLVALVRSRGEGFKPAFAPLYASLATHPEVRVDEVRRMKCVDQAYAAGVRVVPVAADKIEFDLGGGPEVIVRGRDGALYDFGDKANFDKIKDEAQMCAGVVLSMAYPPRMAVVRNPAGAWEVVY